MKTTNNINTRTATHGNATIYSLGSQVAQIWNFSSDEFLAEVCVENKASSEEWENKTFKTFQAAENYVMQYFNR